MRFQLNFICTKYFFRNYIIFDINIIYQSL